MRLDEAKEILSDNGYIVESRGMTEESLAKAIRSLLKNKYELSKSKVDEYFEDIMPINLPKPGTMISKLSATDYAYRLCKDYFNW